MFAKYTSIARFYFGMMIILVTNLSSVSVLAAETSTIKVDGSSTVFPITEAVAEEFQASKKNQVKVTVGSSGTGGGFKKFCRGETDISDASRPIQTSEMKLCKDAGIKYFELPIAFDAIVVAVNPKNEWLKDITLDELKKIWSPDSQGKILTWDQVNSKWPKEKLNLYGAGTDSGTFDYFTEAVVGKAKSCRGDFTASEDDNVLVNGISTDKNSLGFVPYAYYVENKKKLKAVGIISTHAKEGILPTDNSVIGGTYFPLSRPVFIYVSEKSYQRADVKEFVEFYMKNGAKFSKEVKYVPLPNKAYDTALTHLKKNKLGTVFGGKMDIGMKIDDLMKKEAVE